MRAFLVGTFLASLVALASCAESRRPQQARGQGVNCTTCHGDATRTPAANAPAPPTDARGRTSEAEAGVGAHQSHLRDGSIRAALACDACHAVPTEVAHSNGSVELPWGALAGAGGATPSFDAGALTCANYCHGATLSGGSVTSPRWTLVDGTQAACGTCHGIPPPRPHPPVPSGAAGCAECHGGTVRGDGTILVAGGLHLNGLVDFGGAGASCTACHGDPARTPAGIAPAPPVDTLGNTETTAPGVGAHQAHLNDGPVRAALACAECHTVPADVAHAGLPLDLTWGPLARSRGATPSWDEGALTCANYCHGATLSGGSVASPKWTLVDGTQAACGACHGVPPPRPHPLVPSGAAGCVECHAGTARADGTVDVPGGLHVNGRADFSGSGGSCTGCHGDPARPNPAIAPAPPADVGGNTDTTAPGVGAHQAHLNPGPLAGALACTECHTVPGDIAHAGLPLDLTWGPLARAGGAVPSWDAGALTCANYCHGATLPGGSLTAPIWNKVDGSQAACGACHGLPPPAPHPATGPSPAGCRDCHAGTVKADGSIDVAGGLHVDAVLQLSGSGGNCTGCHGDPARLPAPGAAAPPRDAKGNTATTARGVGAHQRHLNGGPVRTALACSECHAVPADIGHAAPPIDLTWGPLARAQGSPTSWDTVGLTCANYCHGATLHGGSNPTPSWTTVDGTQAACGTCHGLPPPAPHPAASPVLTSCSQCHGATMNADGTLNLAGGKHVDGVIQATGGHVDFTEPQIHAPQFFAFISGTPGALGCTGCHGADYNGGMGTSCNGCHSLYGWTGWRTNCSFCHGTRNATTRAGYDPAVHPDWAAPPDAVSQRLTGVPAPDRTGAHQPHLTGLATNGQRYAPAFACATCHAVPADLTHVSGTSARAAVALTGAGQASLPADLGTYDQVSGTCATYCHGSTMVAPPASPVWSAATYWPPPGGATQACERCHGLPPPSGSSAYTGTPLHLEHYSGQGLPCSSCHYDTADPVSYFPPVLRPDVGLHVNGVADVAFEFPGTWDAATGTCATTCHAEARGWR